MANYTVPGVYIEEISAFPPSVAQVPTAIPAFIGYTQMAAGPNGNLTLVPTKVSSLLDYQQYFGFGPELDISSVSLDNNGNFVSANVTIPFMMYQAVSMFYNNGGGDCYVVSTGSYSSTLSVADFTGPDKALAVIETVDEPTLLVFPDCNGVGLTPSESTSVYQQALAQCASLQSRFLIGDANIQPGSTLFDSQLSTFRTDLGINNSSYGAIYTPWLSISTPTPITYADLLDSSASITMGGANITSLLALAGSTGASSQVQTQAQSLDVLLNDISAINTSITANYTTLTSFSLPSGHPTAFSSLTSLYNYLKLLINQNTASSPAAGLKNVFTLAYQIAADINNFVTGSSPLATTSLVTYVNNTIASSLSALYSNIYLYEELAASSTGVVQITGFSLLTSPTGLATSWGTPFTGSQASISGYNSTTGTPGDSPRANQIIAAIDSSISSIIQQFTAILQTAQSQEASNEIALSSSFSAFKSIITGINNWPINVPPAGAVAGIYANVDNTRGVWKAPANVAIDGVLGAQYNYNNGQLSELNVDVNAGMSINAIRNFTGQGTLVYGARTLAGNDNNYRYVSVRRFLIMLEQSVKDATQQFVFEPNDANTWTKVRSMIENFLYLQWRAGALQGAKAEQAFSVACGLGTTMTAQDILNGLMTVSISVAIVHPAEFIVITVQQQLAVS